MTDSARRSLAVHYRPRRFADLTGQRHVAAVLRAAAATRTPSPQLLLSGDSGLGKTTTARIYAAALFCTAPAADGDSCATCSECLAVAAGTHPDVIELDAASNGGVAEIRELSERAALAPVRARWKIYIVDEAHGLTGPGGQAALKLIEEPPAHCIFILATTDPQKLPAALRGRCPVLEALRPTDAELLANLHRVAAAEGWSLTDVAAAAVLAATESALGVRGTLMTLEKLTGPLSAGQEIGEDLLASLLGTPPVQLVRALTDAIGAHDRLAAATALTALRARCSETAVRAALSSWARETFAASLTPGATVAGELALWRYELLSAAPSGAAWTDIAVARLAAPRLEATPEALAALLAQAELAIVRLTGALPASLPSAQPAAAPLEQPAAPTAAAPPVVAPPAQPTVAPATAIPSPTAGQPASDSSDDGVVEGFRTAVDAASRVTGALLRNCVVTVHGGDLVVTATGPLAARLAGQADKLSAVAGELGYGLRLSD